MHPLTILSLLIPSCLGFAIPDPKNSRIVGGTTVDITEYPYIVGLTYMGTAFCGGSILNETLILTSANCTHGRPKTGYYVYGGTNIVGWGDNLNTVHKVYEHPGFDNTTFENDIAIIVLGQPLKYSKRVRAIPLAEKGYVPPVGKMGTVTGFGKIEEGGEQPKKLNKIDVPILDNGKCNELYSSIGKTITEHMFCAGFEEGGQDTCTGDKGGPLVVDGVQIGIASWGNGCARPGYPGVYTHISTLVDFIEQSVGTITNTVY